MFLKLFAIFYILPKILDTWHLPNANGEWSAFTAAVNVSNAVSSSIGPMLGFVLMLMFLSIPVLILCGFAGENSARRKVGVPREQVAGEQLHFD